MIITLSPAKLLDFESPVNTKEHSKPIFINEAQEIINSLRSFSIDDISDLMSINYKQAITVYQQTQLFKSSRAQYKQAAYAYNGIAYKGLDIENLSPGNISYVQDHLVILSGLYGALRPLDIINPYRLEMQAKLPNNKGATLYDYWSDTITHYISERLEKDDKIWVNLMSDKYTKTINKRSLPSDIKIINPVFKEQNEQGLKQVVVYTKKARGMFARFICLNEITDTEHLKAFDTEGYTYSPHLSKGNIWMFIR